jgi:hypothetical protein
MREPCPLLASTSLEIPGQASPLKESTGAYVTLSVLRVTDETKPLSARNVSELRTEVVRPAEPAKLAKPDDKIVVITVIISC